MGAFSLAAPAELANATSILEPLISTYCTSPAKILPSCFFTPLQVSIYICRAHLDSIVIRFLRL